LKDASSLYSEDQNFGAMETINQTMLQIKPELGFGKFVIKTDDTKHKNTDTFALNVFDKFSMTYLEVGTESLHYQYGDKVVATIALKNDDSGYEVDNVDAYLVGPASQIIPLELTEVTPHRFQGSATLLSELNDHGENWYVEANIVSSTGVDIIRRSGHAAFSYSVPSAALLSIVKLTSKPLTFVATIDVATPSRYALQSVLFSQSGSGEPKAIETSQKAQWFDAGKHVIQFTFDNANNLIEDKLYLGYLRLIDYGQLKTVYQYNAPIKLSKLVE